ncbi:MAG: alpha-glucosidase, partial [Rikenellaceae bacterium]|nr:alpha-glucosidase [Rikenellaceae bacterium]
MKNNEPATLPLDTIVVPSETDHRTPSEERQWWKEAVVYQIYPRSFKDSNGDGIGDIPGILEKLDYVKSLGIDMIWLNPIFESPNDDNGYDISDYYRIMPEFGTMADFDRLLEAVHDQGLRLILDLVANHTSDEHPWFQAAKSSREDPHYDWYHWWPAEKGKPPYRESFFDENGTAWQYNEPTDSWYLHYFSKKQPDLNWSNPQVRQEIYRVMRFWFEKGIDGFRMDAIPYIGKDPAYPEIDRSENPYLFDQLVEHDLLGEYLSEMNREVLSDFDVMTVGEGSSLRCTDVSKFVEPEQNQLQMMYHFG